MKVRHGLAVASLVPLITLGGGAAQDASAVPAAQTHRVSLSGSMELRDDETIGSEHARYSISGSRTLTHGSPEGTIIVRRCVGGEVRGELHVDLRLHSNNAVTVSPTLFLYEGTSCGTTDRDGAVNGDPHTIKPGGWVRWSNMWTSNTVERTPGDWAEATFTVTHAR